MCETRWVKHLDSFSLFYGVCEYICSSLEYLNENNLKTDRVKIHALLASIQKPQFNYGYKSSKTDFQYNEKSHSIFTISISTNCSIVVISAITLIIQTTCMMKSMRCIVIRSRNLITYGLLPGFAAAKEMADKIYINLVPHGMFEYRRTETITKEVHNSCFLDHLSMQRKLRFLEHREPIVYLEVVIHIDNIFI